MIRILGAFILFLFSIHAAKAQSAPNMGGGVDDERLHFGFTFQYISAEYKILKKESWREPFFLTDEGKSMAGPYSISSSPKPGFGLGFVSDLRMGTNANLRFTPILAFSNATLDYVYDDDQPPTIETVQKEVQATFVNLPLGIKLKSERRHNFRAYILAGGRYSMDIVSKKKTDDADKILSERFVKNRKSFFSYEAAIGFDLYFEYFKLSPEIKFSQSINSVLNTKEEPNPYTSPVDKLFLRNFQFSLYFE
ncbi:outer membrane beta-barrel protein [Desertivirga xinjiangensis]|uniref:type IX secretion/gliding motility protein PorT/SprT n=1 Tax=Desertivirga xinjiangensis TaxID=539206 RepID=UPI00210D718E|nr:outer membrane beta-barrel protein [Pedobacter xinjiangensis]